VDPTQVSGHGDNGSWAARGWADRSAAGLLKLLLATSVVLPILTFAAASWFNYRDAMRDAERSVLRMSEVAHQHAAKVFDGQSQVVDRVNDLIRGMDEAEIRRSEQALHEAFARIVARLPRVRSVLLAGRDGRPLASAGTYPVPADVTVKDRDYFKAVVDGYRGTYVSSPQISAVNRQLFFGLARPWQGPGKMIDGVIDVAVQPSFFSDFYQMLASEGEGGAEGKVIALVRDDGQVLVRYPPLQMSPPAAPRTIPFFAALKANPDKGVYESRSFVDPEAPDRIFAYERVEGYPVYVVAGRTRAAVIAGWYGTMASHLVFGLPLTVALVAVTWLALVRTRREERALALTRTEIERRKVAEAALLRSQRLEAVGQMTGGIAHDFNNLLTVILGSAEMLRRRAKDPAMVERFAEQILLAAKRGGEVTHQLLSFARRQVVHPETIDLNRRITEFKPLIDRAAREAVRVDLDLDPALGPVRLDPGHLEAAILNLVGNARDAMTNGEPMTRGGRLVISTANVQIEDHPELPAGAYVRVAVSDEGVGMDPNTAAKAFEPFFTTKPVGAGTGLGLSQVYGFARQAGGDVRIETAPGRGTTVELLLPRADDSEVAVVSSGAALKTDRLGTGEAVLVVEDEPELLAMTVECLRDLGYVTRTATTAASALALLAGPDRIDALFSDVVMPGGMDGLQLAQEARRVRPGLRVLLTSGYAPRSSLETDRDIPILPKPYDRSQLAAALSNLLAGRH
jgi:two-component system NtrC family sensor kinase